MRQRLHIRTSGRRQNIQLADSGFDRFNRKTVEEYFGVTVSNNSSLWSENALTPFVGRTLKIVSFEVIERNLINTGIQFIRETSTVLWTMEPGCADGVIGSMDEHIRGSLTGVSHTAGWVNSTTFLENDDKFLLGKLKVLDDWGLFNVEEATATSITILYRSMQKGVFRMRQEIVNRP